MKAFGKILTAALLAGGLAFPASAQSTDSDSATASVNIIQGINLTRVNQLAFGSIVRPATGTSTITMSLVSDTPTESGPGDAVLLTSVPRTRASFTVTGEGAQAINITVPATVTMAGSVSGSILVTLTNEGATDTLSGTIGTTGGFSTDGVYYVGGSFDITPSTPSGSYTVALPVTVAYN